MPGSDGSIIIDTQLDSTGFRRGSDRMTQAVNGVTQAVNQAGANMSRATNGMNSALQTVGRSAATAQQASTTAQQATQALAGTMDGLATENGFARGMTAAERSAGKLESQLTRLGESERMGIKTEAQMTRFQINTEKAADSVTALQEQLTALGNARIATADYEYFSKELAKLEQQAAKLDDRKAMLQDLGVKSGSAQMERLNYQIQLVNDKMNDLRGTMQAMEQSGKAFTMGSDTTQYQMMAQQLADMQQQLAHFQSIAQNFDQISPQAEQAEESLESVDRELKQKPKDASLASRALHGLGTALLATAKAGLKVVSVMGRITFKALAAGAKQAANGMKGFFNSSEKTGEALKGLIKPLTSVKTMLKSRIKRMFISEIMKSVQAAMTALQSYSAQFKASMAGIKAAATGMSGNVAVAFGSLMNAIAPTIITIINLISQAISYLNAFFAMLSGRGTVTVAKKNTDAYAQSLKGAGGAAKELNNQVFKFDELNKEQKDNGGGGGGNGAAAPEFEEVAITDLLPTDVAEFFTRLKEAFANGDWEGVGGIVAEGLNVIVHAVDGWITQITPLALTWSANIARILNGLVSGIDWEGLGATVGNGLNLITGTINTFFSTFDFVKLGAGLARGMNGLFNEVNWTAVGATLAAKWKALIGTIYGFVTTVDWAAFGRSISDGISGWFNTINWTQLAGIVSTGINGIVTALSEVITNTDWVGMATTFVEGVNSIVADIDWEALGTLVGEALQALLDSLLTIITGFDWAGTGTSLASGVNSIVTSIDWASVGSLISTALAGLLTLITNFITTTDWQAIGTSVATFLGGIDWSGLATALFTGIGAALGGIVQTLIGLISPGWNGVVAWWKKTAYDDAGNFTLNGLLKGIKDKLINIGTWLVTNVAKPFIDGLGKAIGIEDLWTVGGNWISGVLTGITNGLTNVGTWLKTNIFDPIVNGFKSLFGIASPSTVMKEQGGFIADGILNGIKAPFVAVSTWIKTNVVDPFVNGFKNLFGINGGDSTSMKTNGGFIASGLLNGIKAPFATISTWLKTNIVDPFVNGFKTLFGINSPSTVMKEQGGYVTAGLSAGFTAGLQGVLDVVSTVFGAIWNAIKNIFGIGKGQSDEAKEAKTAGGDIMSGMADGVTGKEETVKTAVKNAAKTTLTTLKTETGTTNGASTKTKTIGENIVSGIIDGLKAKGTEANFKTQAESIKTAVEKALKTAIGAGGWSTAASKFTDIGKYIDEGVAKGIKDNESKITTAAKNAAQAAYDAAKRKLGINSPSKAFAELGRYTMEGYTVGVKDEGRSALKTMRDMAQTFMETDFGTHEYQLEGTAVVDGMDNVVTKLSGVAQIFEHIASMLDTTGGLRAPAVALGTVAPYRTRVNPENDSTGNSEALRAFTTNFDETMSDQGDLLRELIDVVRRLRLVVDAKSLTNAVTSMQRTQERNYGGV